MGSTVLTMSPAPPAAARTLVSRARRGDVDAREELAQAEPETPQLTEENYEAMLSVDLLEMEVGFDLVPLVDPRKGGECWSCPAKWHRTTRGVTGNQACTNNFGQIFVDPQGMCRALIDGFSSLTGQALQLAGERGIGRQAA